MEKYKEEKWEKKLTFQFLIRGNAKIKKKIRNRDEPLRIVKLEFLLTFNKKHLGQFIPVILQITAFIKKQGIQKIRGKGEKRGGKIEKINKGKN